MISLLASLVCVAQTNVCAPDGSTVVGTIGPSGGEVVLTPSAPMTALGAQFRAGTKVVVDVQPWGSSDGHRGAIVHVAGELERESVVGGARVAGTVRIGQLQGRPGAPILVQATDLKGGGLTIPAGKIELAAGMRLAGSVDLGGVRLEVTSTTPVHALGLDFDPGTVSIEQRSNGYAVRGSLSRPQEIAGVLVHHAVAATIEAGHPRFQGATLARDTPLQVLGLPDGTAPAGTVVAMEPSSTRLFGPVTVCGVALLPNPMPPGQQAAVMVTTSGPAIPVVVAGTLASSDVDLGDGIRMSGSILLGYDAASCRRRRLEGTLSRPTEQLHLHFAATTALSLYEQAGDQFATGTLARPEVVDGFSVTGAVTIGMMKTGKRSLTATLTNAARFEAWEVPARTHIERSGDQWSFTVPPGTSARAVADHHGERIDEVSEARAEASGTSFEVRRPHVLKGTTLALSSFAIEPQTGCVFGGVKTAQHAGIFTVPAGGTVRVCGATVVEAEGTYAVPSLQVGTWFATTAISGTPGAPPTQHTPFPVVGAAATPVTGYWLQINSLCQGASGIPLPPPPQRWIWVDLRGQPATAAERRSLATDAAKPGKPCPVTPCCVP